MEPAPVVAFVFKRPEHARAMLESLRSNPEERRTPVYVFCDGARSAAETAAVEATREVVRRSGLADLRIVERDRNLGLAASVIDGVSSVCRAHGRVIVLEDDLVVAPTFLEYMNDALERYREATDVYAISGYMYPVSPPSSADAAFLPFISSWGWATWWRAWAAFDASASGYESLKRSARRRRRFDLGWCYPFFDMLEAQRRRENDSWAIRWYLSVFQRNGLALFPGRSLVENRGFGEEATHCAGEAPPAARAQAQSFRVERWPEPALDAAVFRHVRRLLARDNGFLKMLADRWYLRARRRWPALWR